MKRIIGIMTIVSILMVLALSVSTYAATLESPSVSVDKELVRPGEQVTMTLNFGEDLGAYTADFEYDKNIFEYVSADGGTANDLGEKVRVVFSDPTGGSSPRSTVSVTFKANAEITSTNPTNISVTAEGLTGPDSHTGYDPITQKMTKTITVEPIYIDYALNLTTTESIVVGKETPMVLSYSSPMGRHYEKARLNVEVTTPEGATLKLLGIDNQQEEQDLAVTGGWGDPQGYAIGGKDVSQVLNLRGIFSDAGNYTVTLKLIDRGNSDAIIAQHTFTFTAGTTPEESAQPEETPAPEETPNVLPKTGTNIYIPIVIILVALLSSYIYFNRNNKK